MKTTISGSESCISVIAPARDAGTGEPRLRMAGIVIRPVRQSDASRICKIYNYYVRETVATFEELPVTDIEMAKRIGEVIPRLPWLVSDQDGLIVGYAYAMPWKNRSAYRFSVECTIYIDPAFAGRGLGFELYQSLLAELVHHKVHCAIGGIALPNQASIALHEKLGFRKIGQLREVGRKFEKWVDVGYWQLLMNLPRGLK